MDLHQQIATGSCPQHFIDTGFHVQLRRQHARRAVTRGQGEALGDMLGADQLKRYMDDGSIEVAPLAYMRGRTLNNAFVILDEAQNTTPEQMKMFLTRIGFGSKAVITGDVTQIDLPKGVPSGLKHAIRILDGVRGIEITRFTSKDVVRHPLVARIVDAYEEAAKQDELAAKARKEVKE